jgi:hypothetical protein
MPGARNVIAVASRMIARYGHASTAMMEKRVEENARAGDAEAAAFWANVAKAVRALDGKLGNMSGS